MTSEHSDAARNETFLDAAQDRPKHCSKSSERFFFLTYEEVCKKNRFYTVLALYGGLIIKMINVVIRKPEHCLLIISTLF